MNLLDSDAIEASFAASQPRRRSLFGLQSLMMATVVCVVFLAMAGPRFGVPADAGLILPPIVIGAALGIGHRASRRRKACRDAVTRAWQHLQFDEARPALDALGPIMRGPITSESDRGQAYMLMAGAAERLGRFDAAVQIYETLLIQRVGDIAQLQEAQIRLAAAKVRNDELTDAVTLIGRLAQVPMPPPLKAAFDLVHLFQQVFMGHHADAIQHEEEQRALFRKYLSTKAAYGYGLLAAAMHYLGRIPDASRLWRDATTLMRSEKLVREYPLLAPVSLAYPAVEYPI